MLCRSRAGVAEPRSVLRRIHEPIAAGGVQYRARVDGAVRAFGVLAIPCTRPSIAQSSGEPGLRSPARSRGDRTRSCTTRRY